MKVTMEYIARMANVSKATVSRVINGKTEGVGEETRQRVLEVINEYGYMPNLVARGVSTARTKTIGLVIPDITNPFFSEVVSAVEMNLRKRGYAVLLCNTSGSVQYEEQSIRSLLARQMDGIILATSHEEKRDAGLQPMKLDVPCVLVDRKSDAIAYDAGIFVDNEYVFFRTTCQLLQHGNRRIAFIKGPDNLSTTQERIRGYLSALQQYDIPLDEALITAGDYSFQSGYDAIMALHEKNVGFSAVISSNDLMALGALEALRDLHISVPAEVEVIGCDNIYASKVMSPALTTVDQPLKQIGETAAKVMLDLISGQKVSPKNVRLDAKIVVRASTRQR